MTKSTHGGRRPNAGRKTNASKGLATARPYTLRLPPSDLTILLRLPKGQRSALVRGLIRLAGELSPQQVAELVERGR